MTFIFNIYKQSFKSFFRNVFVAFLPKRLLSMVIHIFFAMRIYFVDIICNLYEKFITVFS